MKRFLKIFFVNTILILISFLLFEFGCAYFSFNHDKLSKDSFFQKISKTIKYSKIHYDSPAVPDYYNHIRPYKPVYASDKFPVILLGGSYTYGDGLKNEEAFHSVLSKYTHRNVVNLGLCCGSPKEALYFLNNTPFDSIKNKKSDYIIYTYIPDHKRRLYADVCQFKRTPSYKQVGNSLQLHNRPGLLRMSFALNYINSFLYENFYNPTGKDSDLLLLYFLEMDKTIKENYVNKKKKPTKFIILVYEDDGDVDWKKLKDNDITVINLDELTNVYLKDEKYKLPDWHPNAKAWQLIVPSLVKKSVLRKSK